MKKKSKLIAPSLNFEELDKIPHLSEFANDKDNYVIINIGTDKIRYMFNFSDGDVLYHNLKDDSGFYIPVDKIKKVSEHLYKIYMFLLKLFIPLK